MTTIDQMQGSDSMKVFFRMYYDDFLLDYKLFDPASDLETISANQSFPADRANKYFSDKIQISVNNKVLSGKVLSVTIIDNEIFLNLLYLSENNPKSIKIRNRVLIELYSDQTNLVLVNMNNKEHPMKLTPENDMESWSF
jgi:hypothetical protein